MDHIPRITKTNPLSQLQQDQPLRHEEIEEKMAQALPPSISIRSRHHAAVYLLEEILRSDPKHREAELRLKSVKYLASKDAHSSGLLSDPYPGAENLTEAEFKELFAFNNERAENGNSYAQYLLALMYRDGQGIEKSDEKAFEYLLKIPDYGAQLPARLSEEVPSELVSMIFAGRSVTAENKNQVIEFLNWQTKYIDSCKDNVKPYLALAELLVDNPAEAKKVTTLLKAVCDVIDSNLNNTEGKKAVTSLVDVLCRNSKIRNMLDEKLTAKYLEKATEFLQHPTLALTTGDNVAFDLGIAYLNGDKQQGIKENPELALCYLKLAAAQGSGEAKKLVNFLAIPRYLG